MMNHIPTNAPEEMIEAVTEIIYAKIDEMKSDTYANRRTFSDPVQNRLVTDTAWSASIVEIMQACSIPKKDWDSAYWLFMQALSVAKDRRYIAYNHAGRAGRHYLASHQMRMIYEADMGQKEAKMDEMMPPTEPKAHYEDLSTVTIVCPHCDHPHQVKVNTTVTA